MANQSTSYLEVPSLEDEEVAVAPPPPPPTGTSSDDSSVSTCSTTSSAGSTNSGSTAQSSIGRGRLLLPKAFQNNKTNNVLGPSVPPLELPPPPRGLQQPSIPNGRDRTPSPPLLNNTTTQNDLEAPPVVPVYKDENRMLMRSPLPSPRASPKKIIPQPRTLADDSDSEDGRQEREETNMKRLVNMAKQQQNFAAAWFAASAGQDPNILPAMVSSRKRRTAGMKRPQSIVMQRSASTSSSSTGSGPVDLDSGQEWNTKRSDDDKSLSGTSTATSGSTGSSKMRSFLQLVLPSSSSINPDVPPSTTHKPNVEEGIVATSTTGTPNSSDGTINGVDGQATSGDKKGLFCMRKPGLFLILLVLLFSIVAIAVASVLYVKDRRSKESSTTTPTQSPTFSPVPTTSPTTTFAPTTRTPTGAPSQAPTSAPTIPPEPTIAPSNFPSVSPSMFPTNAPSFAPTSSPSEVPSVAPSASPTSMPSASPSAFPTATPSASPTISQAPSSAPSMFPTTEFSTTIFEMLGSTLEGDVAREHYGNSISLSLDGTVMAVGARHFEQDGNRRAGRVHVFDYVNSEWIMRGDVNDSFFGRNGNDQFGYAVSLSDDGNRLAISEPGFDGPAGDRSGNVRIFDWNGASWFQVGNEIGGDAATDLFGLSLALSGDGQRVVVGAPYHDNDNGSLAGRVRVFAYSAQTSSWEPLGDALDGTGELDWFGWAVDLDQNGQHVVIGAPRNTEFGGYVRYFALENNSWQQVGNDIVNDLGQVQPDDRFGLAVSLSSNGQRVAIGSPWKDASSSLRNSGQVTVHQLEQADTWTRIGSALEGEGFNHQMGWSLQLSASGELLSVGIPGYAPQGGANRGRATFHRWDGLDWDTAATPLDGDVDRDEFGFSVAVSDNGDSSTTTATLAVGATVSSGSSAGGAGYVRAYRAV